MPKIKLVCEQCGQEYEKWPSDVKNNKHNFCGRTCYLAYKKRYNITSKCEVCGKIFSSRHHGNANRFCSRECYDKYRGIKDKIRECPVCHNKFEATASRDIYCSWECSVKDKSSYMPRGENHWNWQGGITEENARLRNSPEYKEWQLAVYKKDNYQCQKCGSVTDINAHHIYPWKYFPERRFDVTNGMVLCKHCHMKLHGKYGLDYIGPVI